MIFVASILFGLYDFTRILFFFIILLGLTDFIGSKHFLLEINRPDPTAKVWLKENEGK